MASCANNISLNVFDFSMMKDESDARAPITKPLDMGNSAPLLDSLTAYTDDGSLSSGSTLGSASTGKPRRSMFPQYWKKIGHEPSTVQRRSSAPQRIVRQAEQLLQEQEEPVVKEVVKSSNPRRRSFMPKPTPFMPKPTPTRSYSVSSLPAAFKPRPITRRIVSSCELGENKSCLRQSRFSGARRRSLSISITYSVRFDMDAIDVLHFQTPQERYAEDGWYNYFS
jgi:hypothetical protein